MQKPATDHRQLSAHFTVTDVMVANLKHKKDLLTLKDIIVAFAEGVIARRGAIHGTTIIGGGPESFCVVRFLPGLDRSRELLDALTVIFGCQGITEFAMMFAGAFDEPRDETSKLVVYRAARAPYASLYQFTRAMEGGHSRLREVAQDGLCDGDALDLLRPIQGSLAEAGQIIAKCKALPEKYIFLGL